MRKPLGRLGHATVDVITVPLLLLAARRAGLSGASATWTRIFAGLITTAVCFTRTPLGLVRLVPFRWHGHAEAASIVVQAVLPFTGGFRGDRHGQRFFLLFAAYNFLVWLSTDFRAAERVGAPDRP